MARLIMSILTASPVEKQPFFRTLSSPSYGPVDHVDFTRAGKNVVRIFAIYPQSSFVNVCMAAAALKYKIFGFVASSLGDGFNVMHFEERGSSAAWSSAYSPVPHENPLAQGGA